APSATWQITNIVANPDGSQWYLRSESAVLGPFALSMAGEHNIRNASMALLAAMHVGVTGEECILALEHFVPPKRRMEKICVWKGAMVIDDFAHHPTAIRATLQAVQQQFPTAAIHAIFEPRSNTTTRNIFQDELAECFTGAATVVIGPVHRPERFQPSERLNTNQLISDLAARGINGYALTEATDSWGSSVIPWLETHVTTGDVVLLLSNGNVGGLRSILASA
ncbi:MAG: UDP-N-acetylmuramate--alanine ligase, partial [Ignavibacteria bacterium]|nr:UDP-N-acetylmuramate--alanine ligase [Ignavibacteria bacterium]